jgi:hypothetical protein
MEFESSTGSNLRAVVHEQNSPAERPELQPVARSLELPPLTAQPEPEPSLVVERPEPLLLVAAQLCGPDESPASVPMFEELEALQQRDGNVGLEPNLEAWGGVGTEVAAQFDFGTFLDGDGWEAFAEF